MAVVRTGEMEPQKTVTVSQPGRPITREDAEAHQAETRVILARERKKISEATQAHSAKKSTKRTKK